MLKDGVVPCLKDQTSRENIMNIEEMRMQIQTQLNPNDVENLFFDASESAEGCDDIQLTLNLRTISAYNFGVL